MPHQVDEETAERLCSKDEVVTELTQADPSITPSSNRTEAEETVKGSSSTSTRGVYAEGPKDVLFCKFVVAQVLFNVIASFLGPLGTFYLLFGYLSQGPYLWTEGPCMGVILGSLIGCPLLVFALMPVGMPEAVENGWFLRLRLQDCPDWLLKVCFMFDTRNNNDAWWKRWSLARNIMLTVVVGGVTCVPLALLIARFAVGPTLSTWTLIWFNVAYCIVLAIPVTSLGLLGYSLEHNLDYTLDRMSQNPNLIKRYWKRTGSSLKLTLWPR